MLINSTVSPNPYVAQQAMLFIAEVAPRAPEQALQSVMPIFTFVGANVLHRDDSASARTVEKVYLTAADYER